MSNYPPPDRNQRRIMKKLEAKQPSTLHPLPRSEWPKHPHFEPLEVWRSRGFLVQICAEPNGYERMTVCRTTHNAESWDDLITWDELMALKRECGRGDRDALELYPADRDVVNVANMRHLFFPPHPVEFKWTDKGPHA